MDVTTLFKASVKTLKTRNKALGFEPSESDRNKILKTRRRNEFIVKCKELVHQISQLRDFLLEHRKSYLNFSPSFIHSEKITDIDRDKIDAGAQKIIKTCSTMVANYKRELQTNQVTNQAVENQRAILDLIETYLKTVDKIYTDQKAIRMKWVMELQKISKLESKTKMSNLNSGGEELEFKKEKEPTAPQIKRKQDKPPVSTTNRSSSFDNEDNQLSEEEMQMFEVENQMLFNELNSLSDEVKEIQSKVVRIAELQEVFTEKVLEQNEDIERITTTLVGTTENVKDANTQIRQAIQNDAGLRVYILFFLLVISFTLLFLDWYND